MTTAIEKIIEFQGLLLLEVDCTVAMPNLPAECVDSIVTDPPYGLEFMGKEWDKLGATIEDYSSEINSFSEQRKGSLPFGGSGQRVRYGKDARSMESWHLKWATAAFRLLKPGGHMLVFGGTRTYHRLACAVEDAGFEIRDSIHWLYGSGFPKSLDVSKAIDKAAGAERVVVGVDASVARRDGRMGESMGRQQGQTGEITEPSTDDAKEWDGWGTALKPAHEPILLARKPLGEKTVAANVLKHGTGGLNIDGGRIEGQKRSPNFRDPASKGIWSGAEQQVGWDNTQGRWPANLILQHGDDCSDDQCVPGCPVAELDAQSGVLSSGKLQAHHRKEGRSRIGTFEIRNRTDEPREFGGDKGGASRFFYQAKSSSSERNKGCEDLYWARTKSGHTPITQCEYEALDPKQRAQGNIHPTVKPIPLMRYLVCLITPPGGTVLDPFLGSGTTALAANLEGFGCLAMESDPTSVLVARARWDGLHQ